MNLRLPTSKYDEQSSRVLGLYPAPSAAAVVIGLNVDPGASCPCRARETSGVPDFEEYNASSSRWVMPPTQTPGW